MSGLDAEPVRIAAQIRAIDSWLPGHKNCRGNELLDTHRDASCSSFILTYASGATMAANVTLCQSVSWSGT